MQVASHGGILVQAACISALLQAVECVGWDGNRCFAFSAPLWCHTHAVSLRTRTARKVPGCASKAETLPIRFHDARPVIMTSHPPVDRPRDMMCTCTADQSGQAKRGQAQATNNEPYATNLKHAPRFLRACPVARNVKRTTVQTPHTGCLMSDSLQKCFVQLGNKTDTAKHPALPDIVAASWDTFCFRALSAEPLRRKSVSLWTKITCGDQ
jgi:hypothetical protein